MTIPGATPTSRSARGRELLSAAAAVSAVAACGVLLGAAAPGLAPGVAPHPVLHGTVGEAAAILAHNLRLLATPLILAGARFARSPATRLLGDVLVGALVLSNPLLVGLALGRDQAKLVAYLPGLPCEWAALTVAAAGWLAARRGADRPGMIGAYGAVVLVLCLLAAGLETFATPHLGRR